MKILTVVGARPQFVKAAAVSREIANRSGHDLREVIVHTGQHFDAAMSEVFFDQLGIPRPDYDLGVSGLGHGAMTGRMLEKIELVILEERPDVVLVYGDTNSTLAGALADVKLHVPVAHVEAGLRSGNARMPEEINRVLTDRASTLLFCPTELAHRNLEAEGFPHSCLGREQQVIERVGDVMYDVVLHYRDQVRKQISLASWGVRAGTYALCTVHRAENTDDPERLRAILEGARRLSDRVSVIMPLHPRTRGIVEAHGWQYMLEGIQVVDPQPYLEMLRLEMDARVIVTDSGGMQKEAYFFGVPCLTLRDETEWRETVDSGRNILVGASADRIVGYFDEIEAMPSVDDAPYGHGDAARLIVDSMAGSLART